VDLPAEARARRGARVRRSATRDRSLIRSRRHSDQLEVITRAKISIACSVRTSLPPSEECAPSGPPVLRSGAQ
jgi:hypothetical protein